MRIIYFGNFHVASSSNYYSFISASFSRGFIGSVVDYDVLSSSETEVIIRQPVTGLETRLVGTGLSVGTDGALLGGDHHGNAHKPEWQSRGADYGFQLGRC